MIIIKLSDKFKVLDVWKKNIRKFNIIIFAIVVITTITTASGHTEILDVFNSVYGTANTRLDSCDVCHIPNQFQKAKCEDCYKPDSPEQDIILNNYGIKIKENLNMDSNQAFESIENLDSDKDRFLNIDEIRNLTFPGDKKDSPKKNNYLISTLSFPTNDPTSTIGKPQLFLIKLNKMVNIAWYINGFKVQNDSNTISAIYANFTAGIGTYNIKAIAKDGHDTVSRKWNWTVTPQITYNVSGYVSDKNGSGLEGVLVQNGGYQNQTSLSGYYSISGLLNGTYNFSYNKTGFDPGYLEVIITGADAPNKNKTLYDTTPPVQVTGLLNDTSALSSIIAKPLSNVTLSDFNEIIRFVFDI